LKEPRNQFVTERKKQTCKDFIRLYGPHLVELISKNSNVNSHSICQDFGLCSLDNSDLQEQIVFPTFKHEQAFYFFGQKNGTSKTFKMFLSSEIEHPMLSVGVKKMKGIKSLSVNAYQVNTKLTTFECQQGEDCEGHAVILSPRTGEWLYVEVTSDVELNEKKHKYFLSASLYDQVKGNKPFRRDGDEVSWVFVLVGGLVCWLIFSGCLLCMWLRRRACVRAAAAKKAEQSVPLMADEPRKSVDVQFAPPPMFFQAPGNPGVVFFRPEESGMPVAPIYPTFIPQGYAPFNVQQVQPIN